jgi:asparagine synthase (glutamine-hydrolysing)
VIDERPFIEAVLALNMFQPYYIRADCLSPLGDLARMLRQNDEAFIAPNLYMHWALYGAAQRQNTRVFLDGLDGDTTVSHGLGYLAELAGTGKWRLLVQEATALATTSHPSYTPRRIIREYGVEPLIPEAAVRVWRRLRGQPPPGRNTGALVNPDLARRVGLAQRLQLWSRQEQAPRTERDAHLRGLTSPLIPYTLELADKAAAAFGLETRYPFFDQRLIEFCLALPPEQKLHAGWTRAVMRRAMSGILPGEVQWRRHKANLSPNFSRQLLNCERETLEGAVFGDTRVIGKYVNMSELRAAYHRYDASPTQAPEDAKVVYRAVILAAWLEQTGLG